MNLTRLVDWRNFVVTALEAKIPAPTLIGPTSCVESQPGPLAVAIGHTGGSGTLRVCPRCDVATCEPECWVCGRRLT